MPESTHQASGDHPVSSADTRVILRNRAMRTETLLRMKALWLPLTTLVERLGQGPVPLAMNYPVEEAIVLKVIRLENFAANCDNVDRPSEVSLRYQARGHAPLKILPPTSDTYFELRHRLFDHRLEFTSGIAATVSKITLQPVVPVEILFYLDPEDGSIRLSLRNFESLGLREYRVSSHPIDSGLMEAIEEDMLRQTGAVYALLGAPLPV